LLDNNSIKNNSVEVIDTVSVYSHAGTDRVYSTLLSSFVYTYTGCHLYASKFDIFNCL